MSPAEVTQATNAATALQRLKMAVWAPIRAFRRAYLPPLMVYFAYGALGLTAIASSFWVKKSLSLTPAELAALSVWLSLPWAMKMVFGELVDTVRILGSQRRIYVFIGAGLIALSLVLLAGAAGGWLTFMRPDRLYILASILAVLGVVVQDVVADAMTTEVVPRSNADGTPRPQAEIDGELAMVQVLGRIVFTTGTFAVAWLGGYLASVWPADRVFLLGLVIPAISMTGALLVKTDTTETRPTDWTILGGGLAFGTFVVLLALLDVPFNQEITFLVSLGVIGTMLKRVTGELPEQAKTRIFYAALIIFLFRVTPSVGEGYRWFLIDRYGFDERFFGALSVVGTALTLIVAWFLSDALTRIRMTSVLLWLTAIGAVLSLPSLILVFEGTVASLEQTVGIGARSLAIVDTATNSPLVALGMIPLLTLIAINAPAGHRATWFALMSSFMNLALVGGEILTRYLNQIFFVDRGQYAALPALTFTATALAIAIPIGAILAFRRRVD
jgi:MFS family permease